MTKYKEYAKCLYDHLQGYADHVFLLYGDNTDKENTGIRGKMKEASDDESLILIAIGQKIGEGFDFPMLNTLMLVSPVSFSGRLNRDYKGKTEVIVYDYIDSHTRYFARMILRRNRLQIPSMIREIIRMSSGRM